jgi:transducin beta-like protein 2
VWEVCFDKNGSFKEIKRAYELKGHLAGVYHFAFNADTSRMATVSKDNSWKLWNTKSI